jgi:hypothetical protein
VEPVREEVASAKQRAFGFAEEPLVPVEVAPVAVVPVKSDGRLRMGAFQRRTASVPKAPSVVPVEKVKHGVTRRELQFGGERFLVERRGMARVTIVPGTKLFDTWWQGEWDRTKRCVVRMFQVGERSTDIAKELSKMATEALRARRDA